MKTSTPIQRLQVPTGSYVVNGKKNQILEAHLGTCVGVSICDRHANAGGLIHLLLPEPTGTGKAWQPAAYATTGLPLFIQALRDVGAFKDDLEACLAGGALVGPLSENDLTLNIGGRTTEIVEDILNREGIPICMNETGGYFTCCLRLNTETWESAVEPYMVSMVPHKKSAFKKPTAEELDTVAGHARPIPQIALKIIRMIHDQNCSTQKIADEVRQDQVISAKVIRFCNSAFFARDSRIDSIDTALVMIGEKRLMQLAVSAALGDFFTDALQGYSLCKGGLYEHALGTALTSERLAEVTGKAGSGLAYTAGLLHDIGKVVLDQYLAPAFPFFYRRTQIEGVNLLVVEREEFGYSHTEAGAKLADQWSLPENLRDTVLNHHCPEKATVDPHLTHLVYLADLLMSRFLVGRELEHLNTNELSLRLKKVGLSPEHLPRLVENIPNHIFTYASLG